MSESSKRGDTKKLPETEIAGHTKGPPAAAQLERELFVRALEFEDRLERSRFLEESCHDKPELLKGVRLLLQEHDGDSNCLLDRPLFHSNSIDSSHHDSPKPGMQLGVYTLEELIAEGGMGEVWAARQSEPVRRRVAVKLIRPGHETPGVLQRFETERHALAAMEHPSIAKVLDAGTRPNGQPFFVMELVRGDVLTESCDKTRLRVRQRLEIFVQIAQAVQHAHQKGIIHRDLKPSNILVTTVDHCPVAKIIDFGLAKALVGELAEDTLATQFGAVIGTIEYMAPEQAGRGDQDADTRADVYSLGVILYELLTGYRPFESERFRRATLDEMLRIIKEDEPLRPSTRLSSSKSASSFAASRQTEPKKLSRMLRNELDWIVMKALEKDRRRRYQAASDLAADVQRFLAGEPVQAHPPSGSYRLQKYVRKHKGLVASLTGIAAVLLLGIAGTMYGLLAARENAQAAQLEAQKSLAAEEIALQQKAEADAARNSAIAVAQQEVLQRRYAEAIADFVKNDFLALTSVEGQYRFDEPSGPSLGKDATLRQLLDRAAKKLAERDDVEPRTQADLCWMMGVSYRAIGESQLAIPLLEQCAAIRSAVLGATDPETLNAQNSLAVAYRSSGRLSEAVQLQKQTLELTKSELGEDHEHTIARMNNLSATYRDAGFVEEALSLSKLALQACRAKVGDDHPDTVRCMSFLAGAYRKSGDLSNAVSLYEQTLKLTTAQLGEDHLQTLANMNNLGDAYREAGQLSKALPLCEMTLQQRTAKLGEGHPETLRSMNSVARVYLAAGKLDQARTLFQQTLELRISKLGEEHPSTLDTMNDLARTYSAAGQLSLAEPLFQKTLGLIKDRLGDDHPQTLFTMNNLALAYRAAARLDMAIPLFEETLERAKARFGESHPFTLRFMNNLATGYWSARRLDKSVALFEETLRLQEGKLGRDDVDTLFTVANLAVNYFDLGRLDDAIPLLEEVHQSSAKYPELDAYTRVLRSAYIKAKLHDAFDELVDKQLVEARRDLASNSSELALLLANIGWDLLRMGDYHKAEVVLRQNLNIRQMNAPNVWSTFNAQSMLGGALLGLKKHEEARPLLVAGYEGMKQRQSSFPAAGRIRLREAVGRLIELHTATGNSDELQKWQAEYDALNKG